MQLMGKDGEYNWYVCFFNLKTKIKLITYANSLELKKKKEEKL